MEKQHFSTQELFNMLNENSNGVVNKEQFVRGLGNLNITGILQADLLEIFEALDTDGNMFLSINEFAMYLSRAT